MTASYSTEIKIVIFQFILERWRDKWRSSSNCGQMAANIAHFNSGNSEIVGRMFTKFGHDVAWLLPLNLLKANLRSANPLLNASAKSKGRSAWRRLYNFFCLNSWFTEPNLTKFLQGVQEWLPITLLKSKLRSSNQFGNTTTTNENRRQIVGELWQKLRILTA